MVILDLAMTISNAVLLNLITSLRQAFRAESVLNLGCNYSGRVKQEVWVKTAPNIYLV